ncbi:MAG: polysaccharide biosynthesis tyrosine autokinase [Candidatus Omnitrophica bacterium]|nr:polysaccharide biosynthesis tyrosine autokinase [Candidatus Omnitrophota bacterium]
MEDIDNINEVPLSEYWRIVKKRRMTVLAIFLAVIASTAIFTSLQPSVYEASIELKIEKSVPLGRDLKADAQGLEKPLDLGTELRLFKSLNILSKVVEKVEVLPVDPEQRSQALHAMALAYQSRIRVEQIPDTTIIVIHGMAESPEKAKLLVSAIGDVYAAENIHGKKKQMEAVLVYIDGQVAEYKKQMEDTEAQLLKFKQDEKVFAVTPEVKASLDRMTVERTFDFESQMLSIDTELKSLTAEIDAKKAAGTLKFMTPEQLSDNFIFTGLKRRMQELEFERFLLLVDYTEKHPAVVEKDKTISEIKSKIVEMIKSHTPEPVDLAAEGDLALVLKKLFLESRREVIYRIINKYYSDEGSLSSNQRDYVKFTREQERIMNAYNTLLANREEAKLSLASTDSQSVAIVSPASAGRSPISPKAGLNYLVSIVAGLILGVMCAFLQESMDTTISTIVDVEHKLQLSVLGIIPIMKSVEEVTVAEGEVEKIVPKIDTLVTFHEPRSWPAQSFKILRTNLLQGMKSDSHSPYGASGGRVILFTSSEQQEGKSTVIANVAISMAQLGKKTILVECNLRRPTLYKRFGLRRDPGVTDILLGKLPWKEALKGPTDILAGGLDVDKLLKMPGLDNLRIITAGYSIDNISEILSAGIFDTFIAQLRQEFDVILLDCSPVLPVPDSSMIASRVDGVVMVYKVGKTSKDVLRMAKSRLEHANAKILGIVLNQIRAEEQVGASAYHFREYVETKPKAPFSPAQWFTKNS